MDFLGTSLSSYARRYLESGGAKLGGVGEQSSGDRWSKGVANEERGGREESVDDDYHEEDNEKIRGSRGRVVKILFVNSISLSLLLVRLSFPCLSVSSDHLDGREKREIHRRKETAM